MAESHLSFPCQMTAHAWAQVWKHAKVAKETVKDSNLKGDGLTMGGLMVVKKGDAGVQYAFAELNFGDHADPAEILNACKEATA